MVGICIDHDRMTKMALNRLLVVKEWKTLCEKENELLPAKQKTNSCLPRNEPATCYKCKNRNKN